MIMSALRRFSLAAVLVAAVTFSTGCVVVVDDEKGSDEEWDVSWAGGQQVDRRTPGSELARDVSGRIAAEPGLAGQDITVSSRDGVVTLHGRVESVDALSRAMEVAAAEPGVVRVVSRLTVVQENP
jgi:osmotically-inducible protein OsmY